MAPGTEEALSVLARSALSKRKGGDMKKQTIIRSITLGSGLVILLVLAGVSSALAASVSLPNITIPSGGSALSQNFTVNNRGGFMVTVRLRTAHPTGLIGGGGTSRYIAELMRSNNTTVLAKAERTVGNNFENVVLNYNVADCSQTGSYRIRVRNISTDNPQMGEASFPTFNVPSLDPASGQLSMFGVKQGNTIDRSIQNSLQPSGTGGLLRVTATWDSICLPDPAGCKMSFRLLRNGATISNAATYSTGYAHNAMFGNASPKMTISYNVPANLVQGTWSLRVTGSPLADTNNVITKINFTPACQN
jgi:hypothetical protein